MLLVGVLSRRAPDVGREIDTAFRGPVACPMNVFAAAWPEERHFKCLPWPGGDGGPIRLRESGGGDGSAIADDAAEDDFVG